MVTRTDYMGDAIEAARSVLLELTRLLGAYREHLVLVGGWVPELLLPEAEPKHVGSLDIDLALDHRKLAEPEYQTIHVTFQPFAVVCGGSGGSWLVVR